MKETRDRFCFDIKAQRREIYQLLYDSVTGKLKPLNSTKVLL